ncbi:hypothetical protein [Vibrio metoecus]|uniref:Uncharacterized protein n=1 Tax=Vibrio metoecus TaxID=1481663 RepID=A0A271VW17_VIBMT|nr:hypothetical protein [Vibrio metoecus]KQB10062.1 hypothetical protein XV94_07050 [Vibrio metoecus]PAR22358.1 hypothetical protein CGU03_03145 [Vibrio metoecus]PAR24574.1 hypothetical protein CGU02_07945 [Vibrio metoecus]
MEFVSVGVSAFISFSIAWLGWHKLEKRADRSSHRSETFSLLAPTIRLIDEFRSIAEDALLKQSSELLEDKCSILLRKQLLDAKFHSKYNMFKTKLSQLESRRIGIPSNLLIELRIAFTDGSIDSLSKYSKALLATDRIETELYNAFERTYPKIK